MLMAAIHRAELDVWCVKEGGGRGDMHNLSFRGRKGRESGLPGNAGGGGVQVSFQS